MMLCYDRLSCTVVIEKRASNPRPKEGREPARRPSGGPRERELPGQQGGGRVAAEGEQGNHRGVEGAGLSQVGPREAAMELQSCSCSVSFLPSLGP